MQIEDIQAVMEVERQSFSMPWPGSAYKRELKENKLARYIVARRRVAALPNDGLVLPTEDPQRPPRQSGFRGLVDRMMGAFGSPDTGLTSADEQARLVVGYAGLWLMVDESHVTSIAVAPAYRGYGVGELLFLSLVDLSKEIGAHYVTLEVRASNDQAQALYRKYGFKETGVRRRYYTDNNEDALIMWSDPLESPGFVKLLEQHRRNLLERMHGIASPSQLQLRRPSEST